MTNAALEPQWVCTDPDREQYGRQISDRLFEFKEEDVQQIVDLIDYSEDSMYDLVCSYYGWDDFQEFLKTPDGLWIIAECIFEQESGLY